MKEIRLTDELNWLARRTYTLPNLAMMHVARQVMGIPPDLPLHGAGELVDSRIQEAISTLPGHEFLGRWYDGQALGEAVQIQLGIGWVGTIPALHFRLMEKLGEYYSEPAWRKGGHRWRLLYFLAERIMEINYQTAN